MQRLRRWRHWGLHVAEETESQRNFQTCTGLENLAKNSCTWQGARKEQGICHESNNEAMFEPNLDNPVSVSSASVPRASNEETSRTFTDLSFKFPEAESSSAYHYTTQRFPVSSPFETIKIHTTPIFSSTQTEFENHIPLGGQESAKDPLVRQRRFERIE